MAGADHHFTFFDWVISPKVGDQVAYYVNTSSQKLLLAGLLAGGLCLLAKVARDGLSQVNKDSAALIPPKRPSIWSVVDLFMEKFLAFHDSVLGKENRRYLPFHGTLFLFILAMNVVSLIPGMPAATTTVWINVALALSVFLTFNYFGIQTHGLKGYLKHFCGPVWWLAWMIFPLEIFSTCLRVLTLNMRIYWNITADHLVLGIATDMTKFVIPVAFYALGAFVSIIQAVVFVMLSMIYIQMATQHSEAH